MADTKDLKSFAHNERVGSSPTHATIQKNTKKYIDEFGKL